MLERLKSLRNHQGFMKYLKNTSWLFAEKVLRMVVGLFVGIWVARYLGPEQFGLFSYAQSFVGLFLAISTLGLDGIVIRELVKDESRRDKLIGTAFWLKLFGAFGVLLLLFFATGFSSNDEQTNVIIFLIASSTIFQSFNVIDFYFQSRVMSKYVVYANTITLFFSSIVKITLILSGASLLAFAGVVLFDSVILALGLLYFYTKNNLSLRSWHFDKAVAIGLLKDSWPLILSSMVISIYMKVDQVMIKEMLDVEAVGQYAAAVRISEAWYFIPMVISASLFPAIINAKKVSEELYYERLQKLYDLMVWLAIAIALPMTFLSDWVIELLYGQAYAGAGDVLMIHIWAGVFVFLGVARSPWLINENLQRYTPFYLSVSMLVNILFNYLFIPSMGINAAAYGTLLAQATGAFIAPIFIKKMRISFFMMIRSLLLFPSILRMKKND
jgi:O-antigen/teichoic acid export membrane protein